MKLIDADYLKRDLLNNAFDNIKMHEIIDNQPELTLVDPSIIVPTTFVSSVSSIPWKKVRKLVNDSIAAGANVDISCDADGSWNVAIYPPEKHESIPVPIGNTIYANKTHGLPIHPPRNSISG